MPFEEVTIGSARLIRGDCREVLASLPAESVHMCVTSPPYYGLRDYGCAEQIGLETTPAEYIAALVDVFREVRRVLRKDGTLWLVIGDSYNAHPGQRKETDRAGVKQQSNAASTGTASRSVAECKPKDLLGIPWMLAFALRDDGWYLRRDIIWHKPNPMPESMRDRCTSSHEYLFHLSKAASYYYDSEAIKEPAETALRPSVVRGGFAGKTAGTDRPAFRAVTASRNKRSVWTVTSAPFKGAHFATFPPKLIEPCILAGTSAKGVCPKCGAPWERVVSSHTETNRRGGYQIKDGRIRGDSVAEKGRAGQIETETIGWRTTCSCAAGAPVPATVLDPFGGASTTALVADRHGRRSISIELSRAYFDISCERMTAAFPDRATRSYSSGESVPIEQLALDWGA